MQRAARASAELIRPGNNPGSHHRIPIRGRSGIHRPPLRRSCLEHRTGITCGPRALWSGQSKDQAAPGCPSLPSHQHRQLYRRTGRSLSPHSTRRRGSQQARLPRHRRDRFHRQGARDATSPSARGRRKMIWLCERRTKGSLATRGSVPRADLAAKRAIDVYVVRVTRSHNCGQARAWRKRTGSDRASRSQRHWSLIDRKTTSAGVGSSRRP
jgi:hypothetical protein